VQKLDKQEIIELLKVTQDLLVKELAQLKEEMEKEKDK
jgi:hypothetical protein